MLKNEFIFSFVDTLYLKETSIIIVIQIQYLRNEELENDKGVWNEYPTQPLSTLDHKTLARMWNENY